MNNIELNFGNSGKEINFDNLSTTQPSDININRNIDISDNVKSFSDSKPNLTMSSNKEFNIGLDLLANPSKLKPEKTKSSSSLTNTMPSLTDTTLPSLTNTTPSISSNIQEVKFDVADLTEVSLDSGTSVTSGTNNTKPTESFSFDKLPESKPPTPPPVFKTEEERQKEHEAIQKEKFELLCLFERLEKRGTRTIRKFTMNSNIEEMRYEYNRIKKQRDIESSVKFQRKMLMACVTGIEFLNNRFDPFDIQLDGWSEAMHENLDDYDEVFEELYEKYNAKANIAPELKLMLMVGGSAFMFHLTNTMFKSSLPGMGDIMKQNPELMQQFAKAAMSSMSGGMGGGMGSNNRGPSPMRRPSSRPSNRPPQPPMSQPSSNDREMKGPPDIDSILSQLSEENNVKNINLEKKKSKGGITLDL